MNEPRVRFARALALRMLEDVLVVQESCLMETFPALPSYKQRLLMRQWRTDQSWLAGEDALLSFELICAAMGLEPEAVQEHYRARQAQFLPELERRVRCLSTRRGKLAWPSPSPSPSL